MNFILLVGQEDDLQPTLRHRVAVDGARKVIDEFDDQLCQVVGWCRFAGKEECPGRNVQIGIFSEAVVENDDTQSIEQLPLVFVDSLDLAVENGVWIDSLAQGRSEPVGKLGLGVMLRFEKRASKGAIAFERPEFAQLAEIRHPAVAHRVGDRSGKRRIC